MQTRKNEVDERLRAYLCDCVNEAFFCVEGFLPKQIDIPSPIDAGYDILHSANSRQLFEMPLFFPQKYEV